MQLVIHAGIHRTGTTSLQRTLARNRAALLAQGVAYPGEAPNHQALAWELVRGQSGAREVLALVEARRRARRVVLSGEDFAIHEDLGWLAAVAARHDVRVVIYLRRQDHWLMSWYNQHVKWPFDRAKSRMDRRPSSPRSRTSTGSTTSGCSAAGARCSGEERVGAAVLEKGQVEDATADFLARAGIDPAGLELDAERANDSLPVHMLEIARHLGLHELKGGKRTRVLNALREPASPTGRRCRGSRPSTRPRSATGCWRASTPRTGRRRGASSGARRCSSSRRRGPTRPTGASPSSRATPCSTTGSPR